MGLTWKCWNIVSPSTCQYCFSCGSLQTLNRWVFAYSCKKKIGCQTEYICLLCLLFHKKKTCIKLQIHKHSQNFLDFIPSNPCYDSVKLWKSKYAGVCAKYVVLHLQYKGPAPTEQDLHELVYLCSPMKRVHIDRNTKEHKH